MFLQKDNDISKIKRVLVLKDIISETTYVCVLTYLQVSSIILTIFRQGEGGNFTLPPQPPQNRPLKCPPRLGMFFWYWSKLKDQ